MECKSVFLAKTQAQNFSIESGPSYTTFKIAPSANISGDKTVEVMLENTGNVAGTEVIQEQYSIETLLSNEIPAEKSAKV